MMKWAGTVTQGQWSGCGQHLGNRTLPRSSERWFLGDKQTGLWGLKLHTYCSPSSHLLFPNLADQNHLPDWLKTCRPGVHSLRPWLSPIKGKSCFIYIYIFGRGPHCVTCGILVRRQRLNPGPWQWKAWSPNHWMPGKSLASNMF